MMNRCLILLLLSVVLGSGQTAWALPGQWQVMSRVSSPFGGVNATLHWSFVQDSAEGESMEVQAREEHLGLAVRLTFQNLSARGNSTTLCLPRLIQAAWTLYNRGQAREFVRSFVPDQPALVLQKNMPVDWLNVDLPWQDGVMEYKVVQKVAGFAFARRIEVRRKLYRLSELQGKGFLSSTLSQSVLGEQAMWVDVVQCAGPGQSGQNEKLLFSQLWVQGCPFWVYEQTPFRQSWLQSYSLSQTSR